MKVLALHLNCLFLKKARRRYRKLDACYDIGYGNMHLSYYKFIRVIITLVLVHLFITSVRVNEPEIVLPFIKLSGSLTH
jgi:hypothetical protein